ncbi:hypothetical protein M430DRAFT_255551 [Amorphotheca resinae ATCC 22711]|uniref:Uncharacterized protein n=1 Tax=Amorphotheca resinae ATCC 22711 TaxID=857342 RepID=A0A2T3AY69_AMORE|nr:hypothetical protein M430DRAFT_255551 [Amorphotheca resinae ATCC 22711]PSS14991.1 hypothetical protein M430DRAFT_255551 [Amorphotheca resinae ATCC 22711]
MKNFTSILALIALSAGVVTSRALPVGDGLVARVPYPIDTTKLSERIPKKDKEHNAANSTISAATSLTSSTSGDKKKGKGKGAAHSAAQNGTAAADTGKKGKGGANSASQDKGAANANDAAAAQSGESGVDSIVQSLTGINLGSLGLRSPSKLEARKGKEAATPVASGVAAVGTGKSAAKKVGSQPLSPRIQLTEPGKGRCQ